MSYDVYTFQLFWAISSMHDDYLKIYTINSIKN